MSKWYKQGFKDAIEGLPLDPPMNSPHKSYRDYVEEFGDGVRQLDVDADEAEREEERRRVILQDGEI